MSGDGDVFDQSEQYLGSDGHVPPIPAQIEPVRIGRVCISGEFVVPLTPEQADRRFVMHAQEVAARYNSKSESSSSVGFGVGRDRPSTKSWR